MVDEYVLWKKNDSDCYPSQELIGREFAYLFNENLRIEGYPIVYEGKVKIVNSMMRCN